jgi:predicted metal-dependent hydrolase
LEVENDPRFIHGLSLFNQGSWYACHDAWEELWLETNGSERSALQGLLQIAVAHLHLERNNRNGAMILIGEGLGRLSPFGDQIFGLDLGPLKIVLEQRLRDLQAGGNGAAAPLPRLRESP